MKKAESLGGFGVVFMCFWQAAREVEMRPKQTVAERQFNEILFRKNLLHFSPDRLVETIVIIYIEESAAEEVMPKALRLEIRENDVSMTGHEQERVRKKRFTGEIHNLITGIGIDLRMFAYKFQKIDLRRGIIIPVPASAVFEPGDTKLTFNAWLGLGIDSSEEQEQHRKSDGHSAM
jgi:hypothetical protein